LLCFVRDPKGVALHHSLMKQRFAVIVCKMHSNALGASALSKQSDLLRQKAKAKFVCVLP